MNEKNDNSLKETVVRGLAVTIEKSISVLKHGINRFETEIYGVLPIDWLNRQNCSEKIYFSDRDNSLEVAAIGRVKVVTQQNSGSLKDAIETIANGLESSCESVKYFGGICFDSESEKDGWEGFGKYWFVVPQFEIRAENGKTVFAWNVDLRGENDFSGILEHFEELIETVDFAVTDFRSGDKYSIAKQDEFPDKNLWHKNVKRVIADLGERDIQKVVLARKCQLQTFMDISPVEILKRLKTKNVITYDFCFQLDGENSFIGSSPECLFDLRGKDIYSEAIAGTRLKGTDTVEQKKYRAELIESEKEQLEHDYVLDDIRESLAEICQSVQPMGGRKVVSLEYLQHFCSSFNGRLNEGVTVYDIIASLHPTAAVNGYPSGAAMQEIRRYEPFSRGWFAGPVGWIGKDSASFAVAIRSALIGRKQISLFAGAGIVKSSDPEQEWQETENKIKQYLDLFE